MPVGISLLWLYWVTTRQQWQYRLKVHSFTVVYVQWCYLVLLILCEAAAVVGFLSWGGGIPQNISDRELGTSDLFRNTALEKQNIDHITYHRFNTNTSFGIDPPLLVYRGDYFGRTPNLEINWNNLKTILEFALVWEFSSIIHSKCQYQVKLHCCKSVNQQLALDAEWEGHSLACKSVAWSKQQKTRWGVT